MTAFEGALSGQEHATPPLPGDLLRFAETIYRFRRIRDDAFGDLFSDPRWDILLDLFIGGERRKRISVSSACIGAAAPTTTAMRHLTTLVNRGLVSRFNDEGDGRVVHVELTREGRDKVAQVLRNWSRVDAMPRS